MKYSKILALLFLCSVFSIYACKDKSSEDRKQKARESIEVADTPAPPNAVLPPPPPTTPEPAQNADGVWHYTCSKGCAGGAGAVGNCATCGGPLAHNSAYHANAANNTQPTTPITPPITPPTTEPAQNAAGVWHYTCSNGCAGGAGAVGNCATCGGKLAHNTAYHQ